MAQHNPASRTFLLIVLAGIVIGFVIALFLFGGDDSETGAKMDETQQPAADAAPEQPSSAQPAAEAPVERPVDDMTDGMTPPDEMPMDDGGLADGVTPPDEMLDQPLPDGAPDAASPEQTPEAAAPETPPPAPNP